MKTRPLGATGLDVAPIGFGAWQLGNRTDWSPMSDADALRLVGEALDAGVTLFDTAPNYAASNSERLLGEALRGRRDEVVLVSKYGHRPDGTTDFSAGGLPDSLHASLRRLRTGHLDVLLVHDPPRAVYSRADPLWEELEAAKRRGEIRHYGASVDTADEIELCLEHTGSTVLEVLFNVLHQDVRRAFPRVRDRGTGLIAKIPLDSGWLTGRYHAASRFDGVRARWSREEIERRADLVGRLRWLTADGTPLARKALAFVLSFPEVGCTIPGVRTPEQLRDNLAATGAGLSAEDRRRLEDFWDELSADGRSPLPW